MKAMYLCLILSLASFSAFAEGGGQDGNHHGKDPKNAKSTEKSPSPLEKVELSRLKLEMRDSGKAGGDGN